MKKYPSVPTATVSSTGATTLISRPGRPRRLRLPEAALGLAFLLAAGWAGAEVPASPPPPGAGLVQALAPLLGRPFREDGAQDEEGRWVTFNRPAEISPAPGFNCSGFTVAAARILLARPFTLAEAVQDRRGDSGPGAPLGPDWDFGLDLILNLSEGRVVRTLPVFSEFPALEPLEAPALEPLEAPALAPQEADFSDSPTLGWGVDLHSPEFEEWLAQIRPGNFAFFCLSRPDGRFPAGVSYYHVGLIVPEPPHLWLYHSTLGRATHRVDLADPGRLARFRGEFPPPSRGERRIFMIEVAPEAGLGERK